MTASRRRLTVITYNSTILADVATTVPGTDLTGNPQVQARPIPSGHQNAPNASWMLRVRALAERGDSLPDELYRLAVAGASAWRIFLSSGNTIQTLQLGSHFLSWIPGLASQCANLWVVDDDDRALELARESVSHASPAPSVELARIAAGGALPFADASVDNVVTTAERLFSDRPLCTLEEIRRVLRPRGQLLVVAPNRFDYQALKDMLRRWLGGDPGTAARSDRALSLRAYKAALRRGGYADIEVSALVNNARYLQEIRPLEGRFARACESNAPPGLANRKLLAACYALCASPQALPNRRLLTGVLDALEPYLHARYGSGQAAIGRYTVTRKEKLVAHAVWRATSSDRWHAFILKVPLCEAATESERRNFASLERLAETGWSTVTVPAPLGAGQVDGVAWFAESRLSGEPIATHLRARGRAAVVPAVRGVFAELGGVAGALESRALDGAFYDRFIEQRIERLRAVVDDDGVRARLSEYFRSRLYGLVVPIGMNHGDFSVQNIFHHAGTVSGLIDWETADASGIPVLDAINLLDSVQRATDARLRVRDTIPMLAERRWPDAAELEFLRDAYAPYGVDAPDDVHAALVYLRWLRHVSYLSRFWLRYDSAAIRAYIGDVIAKLPKPGAG